MRVDVATVGYWRVVSAAGELDLAAVPALRRALAGLLDSGVPAVVVDLSGVSLLDCACVGVLVEAAARGRTVATELWLVGARPAVCRILEITGAVAELGVASIATQERSRREASAREVEAMLAARAALPEHDGRRQVLRDLAVEACLPLARRLANQYRRQNEPVEELAQVAAVGLVKAVDRFDPARGTSFLAFVFPTVLGELRRYFRDETWAVHVPRHLQELRLSMNRTAEKMAQDLGRVPTALELGERLDEPVGDLREAMVAAAAYTTTSLSHRIGDGRTELGDLLGGPDADLERVDFHESLAPLMARLPLPERQVVVYRFFGNMTQVQIGEIVGVSQMQVSRLLVRAVRRLRAGLLADDTPAAPG